MAESVSLSVVAEVLRDAGLLTRPGDFSTSFVSGVSQDSRAISPGDLFLAWRGTEVDAHEFLGQAEVAGAVAAVVEREVEGVTIPQLVVSDGRAAAAVVADLLADSPWRGMFVAGVTGTNGKTTTALVTRQLLQRLGSGAAVGTLGLIGPDGAVRPGTEALTTPGPVQVSGWLRGLADQGVTHVVMEASSHALEQKRLDGVRFDVAVFTNLTQDHLDYHGDLDTYRAAKGHLADLLKPAGLMVLNSDDPAWEDLPRTAPRTISFGRAQGADLRITEERHEASGSSFKLTWEQASATVRLPLPGAFNVENAVAAAAVGLEAGLSIQEVAEALGEVTQVPGRLERVMEDPFTVIVDFAHTPGALDRVLATVRSLTDRRLIVVFGAGGDRDRTKRPRMAAAASRHADLVVMTSDNPRTEDPERILDDVVSGVGEVEWRRITDRLEAIRFALGEAASGDVVLLAGKGHETYQVVGTEKRPFDERSIVADWARERGVA
jgi:UDP-N-acetylmuramoyl-L-alanyl-D-glutamate--2,6-diaminopimelate ligase